QSRERHGLVGLRSEYADSLFDVCDLNFFEWWCVVETAHGLLNVVQSITAQVAVDVHFHLLDLCARRRRQSQKHAEHCNQFDQYHLSPFTSASNEALRKIQQS